MKTNTGWAALLFFLFVLVGCGYILAAKLFGAGAILVTFGPVAIMIAYAAMQWVFRSVKVRDDQAGDNLYYMGFLFTLTSLGASLYQFSDGGAAETIVQNFGIAIGSTIAGVALRVIFNQMRQDPAEVEQASRLELAEAARRVRRELEGTVVEMNHFRRTMQQSLREAFDELYKDVIHASEKLSSEMTSFPSAISKPLQEASQVSSDTLEVLAKAMLEKIEAAGARLAEESDRLAAGAAQITGALDQTAQRLGGLQTPDQILRIQIEPVTQALAGAINEFRMQVEAHRQESNRVLSVLEGAGQYDANRIAQMESIAYSLQQSASALQDAAAQIGGIAQTQANPYFETAR